MFPDKIKVGVFVNSNNYRVYLFSVTSCNLIIVCSLQTQRQGALLRLLGVRTRVDRLDRPSVDALVGDVEEARDVTSL